MLPTRAASPDFDDAALLMANASQRFLGRHIPGHPYADWFRTAGAFDEIILLMDCCREDLPNVNPSYPSMTELKGNMDAVKYLYGVAARFGQDARETLLGNPPESRGLFSFAVMETLQSGPRDANGELTASILAGSVMKRVRELSDPANPQDPKFILNDFTITAGASPRIDVRVQFAPGAIGEQIELLDGTLKVMAPPSPITASAAPVSLKLQPGIYGLRRAGQNSPSQTFPVSPDRNPIDVTFT
jgi:hypothetical protein